MTTYLLGIYRVKDGSRSSSIFGFFQYYIIFNDDVEFIGPRFPDFGKTKFTPSRTLTG